MRAHVQHGCLVRFVGGPWDGERRMVERGARLPDPWRVLRPPPMVTLSKAEPTAVIEPLTQGEYVAVGHVRHGYEPGPHMGEIEVEYHWRSS